MAGDKGNKDNQDNLANKNGIVNHDGEDNDEEPDKIMKTMPAITMTLPMITTQRMNPLKLLNT